MPYAWSREEENAYRRQRYAKDPAASAKRNKKYLAWKKQQMPDIHRWRAIFYTYGLKQEAWMDLFAKQGFCCKVCHTQASGSRKGWHTHHTGDKKIGTLKVHGILCHHCNVILHKRATPELLRKLADFMESYND